MNKTEIVSRLINYNFWDSRKIPIGFLRKSYLTEFKKYLGSSLIKVLNGQRRSGKSFLLRQIIHYLIYESEVLPENILYLNFENEKFSFIKNKEDLTRVVDIYLEKIAKKNSRLYFFFDEIQEVGEWEKLINSYRADHNLEIEIFITGSNSKLLSSELSTYLTGRYIELKVYPLSFLEYIEVKDLPSTQDSLISYLEDSSLPELILEQDLEIKRSYIRTIKDSILLNDIVRRFNIQNVDLLEKLFLFLVDNISNPFSLNSIEKAFAALGYKTNPVTLGNYIKYLEYSFLIYGVDRYNIKGKRILEGEKKYYLNDLGFRSYLSSSFDPGLSKKLENFVFQCLNRNNYSVYVGSLDSDREVDFVAEKAGERIYIQVAYTLDSDKVVEREYGNLEKIQDNWPKYVLSMDKNSINTKAGIKHIKAWEFDEFLN